MKSTLNKIVKEDNFLSLTGNLIIAFLGFAGFALIARSYTPEIFGQWVLFISAGTFIEMFRFGITNTAVVRYLSGSDKEDRVRFIGSNGLIGLIATILIAVALILCNNFFREPIKAAGYELFFTWYPLMAFINLPWNTAIVIMQADRMFGKILLIKAINSGFFFMVLLINYFLVELTLLQLIWAMIIINIVTSALCIIQGWDGLRYIMRSSKQTLKILLDFGKYTTFTLIGTNMLRSADTFIISLSPLGPAAVALYSIPLKLTELQLVPLRSFAATAFPKMSKASMQGRIAELKKIFYDYSGALTYLFIFISVLTFVLADLFVLLLGGSQYVGVDTLTGVNTATIVRVFSLYGLLLPLDRMTGVGLDSMNRPDKNLIKVGFMVITNVIGDLIAVFIFKSLIAVAIASIIFTLFGVLIGFYFLNKEMKIESRLIFSSGISFYKNIYMKIKSVF